MSHAGCDCEPGSQFAAPQLGEGLLLVRKTHQTPLDRLVRCSIRSSFIWHLIIRSQGFLILLSLALLAGITTPLLWHGAEVAAQERRILSFGSEVRLQKSGDAVITETMSLLVDESSHQFGVARNLPRRILGLEGTSQAVSRTLNLFFCDGTPRAARFVSDDESDVIQIGGVGNEALSVGVHNCVLQYSIANLVSIGKEADGFALPLPGDWSMPINSVELLLRLPEYMLPDSVGLKVRRLNYRTAEARDERLEKVITNESISLRYSDFDPRESLSIAVALPKGFIKRE